MSLVNQVVFVISQTRMLNLHLQSGTAQKVAPPTAALLLLGNNNIFYPAEICHADAPPFKIENVKKAIADLIEEDAERRGDGTSLTGTFVRLAWHCAGTYSKVDGSGGSNGGRMRFQPESGWGANAGLGTARQALEPIKEKFPGISYADLYTLSGVVAVEEAGGPMIPFRLGRSDDQDGKSSPPDGRLPDADKGSKKMTIQHIRDIFYRMGFNDREIVALLGAHALGRCHTANSGYWGPWTYAENTMSNEYFRLLVEERWSPKISHNGQPWNGPDQYGERYLNIEFL
jgi:cytochrome c peroxidase